MKLLCFDATPDEQAYLERAFPGSSIVYEPKKIQEASEERSDVDALSVFVGSTVTEEVLKRFPNVRFIATRSTGFDHIDLATCAKRGIVVANVPSYGEHTVAEFAFGLILALSRKIYLGIDRLKETGAFSYDGLQGFDLRERTIGIIGTGRIGRHAIAMAKGFSMHVVAYDPFPNPALATELGFVYTSLEELLQQSDVVTIHVPYLASTHHLINDERIKMMKPTAILINVSRGGIVDTTALLTALKEQRLAGAGLDVLEEEVHIKDEYAFLRYGHPQAEALQTLVANHELARLPNVLITPHMAFNTIEGVERILKTTAENIEAYMKGGPVNTVEAPT